MVNTSIITEQYVRIHQTPANMGCRLGAFFIDLLLIIAYDFCSVMAVDLICKHLNYQPLYFIYLFIIIPSLLYPVLFEVFNHGRSVGKMLCHTRVVEIDGSMPSLGSTLLRWLLLFVDMVSGIGLVIMLFTRNNQRLGDLAAGTMVIKENNYSQVRVTLDEFNYLDKKYTPIYPEAVNLTINQTDTILQTLSLPATKREEYTETLARKVVNLLKIKQEITDSEEFLTTIYHDYQYFLLEDV